MADGVQDSAGEIVEDIAGGVSFEGRLPEDDPLAATKVPAPDGVPEKFWDAEKGAVNTEALLKSYAELEKRFSSGAKDDEGKDDTDGADNDGAGSDEGNDAGDDGSDSSGEGGDNGQADGDGEGEGSDDGAAGEVDLPAALTAAQSYFTEHGDLPAEARADLHKAGITDQQIDLQIAGVRAYEAALRSSAEEAAGEPYAAVEEAIKWAADNWSAKKITAFNSQSGDVETIGQAVVGLMRDYRKAVPSEGRLANINSGANRGDVYANRGEFDKELAAAGNDRGARRKAIDKLNRSLKAGTIK